MSLFDIFTAVSADAALAGVTCSFGSPAVDYGESPPRIVWVPTTFTEGGARRQGSGALLQRTAGTFLEQVQLHVWAAGDATEGGDYAACQLLRDKLVWAIKNACQGSYQVSGGAFVNAGLERLGQLILLNVTFEVPIVEPSAQAAAVVTFTDVERTAQNQTTSMGFPDGDVTGSPAL